MSLISEALKRQQMERDGKAPPVEAEAPAVTDSADQPTENSADVGAGSTLSLAAAALAGQNAPVVPPVAPEGQGGAIADTAGTGLSLAAAAAATAGPVAQAPPPPPPPPPPMQPTFDTAEEPAIAETVVQEGKSENTGAPPWVVLTSAIAVIVLLVGAAAWAGMFFFERVSSESQEVSSASPATEAPATPPPAVEQHSETASPAELDPPPGTAIVSTPDQPAVEPPDAARPDPPDAQPGVVAETPGPPAQPVGRRADIIWPRLSLSGLVGGKRGGAAIINNQVIGIGEAIEGAVVTDLTKKGATLEYQGESLFLHVGGVIE